MAVFFRLWPPIPIKRPDFWDTLTTIGSAFTGPWCLLGDFNALLSQADKLGGRPVSSSSSGGFQRFITDFGLIDVGFLGHPYTWSNCRSGTSHIQERLDRCFANPPWKINCPNAVITHLPAIHSDHRPLLFHSNPISQSYPKLFRFEAMWLDHPDTHRVIQTAWSRDYSFSSKIQHTKNALKDWNKNVFGNIHQKIKQLHQTIDHLQTLPPDSTNLQLEAAAAYTLAELERREAVFWKEKAKTRWIEEGDSNTHYFHVTTLIHRRYNLVTNILDANNLWVTDMNHIGAQFESYFKQIFSSGHVLCPEEARCLFYSSLSAHNNATLTACPSPAEIHQIITSIGNFKSPGPDGFTVTFYKTFWGYHQS